MEQAHAFPGVNGIRAAVPNQLRHSSPTPDHAAPTGLVDHWRGSFYNHAAPNGAGSLVNPNTSAPRSPIRGDMVVGPGITSRDQPRRDGMESAHIILPIQAAPPWYKGHNYDQPSRRDVPVRVSGSNGKGPNSRPSPPEEERGNMALATVVFMVILLLGQFDPAFAEEQFITPEQIVNSALAHSRQLRISAREIEVAEAKQAEANAQAWPHLSADARAARYTGLHDSAFGSFLVIPAIENRYSAGAGASHPAYTGGRIKSQIASASHQKRASQAAYRGQESDTAMQALTAYWNWSKVYYSVAALQAAVARMEAHAGDMRNLHQAGLATDNDSLATEVLLDQTRLHLQEGWRGINLVRARLAFLTGQDFTTNQVPIKAEPPSELAAQTESELLATAKTNRAEPVARQWELKAAEAQVKTSRAEYRPQVTLTARYEQARPNILNIPPQDKWQDDGFAGVALSWNLFDWGLTRAKVAQASARTAQAKLRLDQAEEQIVLEVREAWIELQNSRARLTVSQHAEQSARRNLEAATDLWQNGLARHSEVLDAHAQLTHSQSEVIDAKADLVLAHAALAHATGLLRTRP